MTDEVETKNGKREVVLKVLTEATGTLTLADAITKAQTLKPLKTKNPAGAWRAHFREYGVVTKTDGVETVGKKPVV